MKPSRLKVISQFLVPQLALSRLAGWLSNCRWGWVKNWEINYFINRYQVNVSEALLTNVSDYPTFNSFFTRLLKPGARPIVQEPRAIACPADGSISQLGEIRDDLLFQAKGFDFSLRDLLGGNTAHAATFLNGCFATIYLSPKDYHRVHMPVTGTLRETIYIPGKLFSVNQKTVCNVPQLFARNERLVCVFDTAIGLMIIILVGAMLVGSINTVWHTYTRARKIITESYSGDSAIKLERGDEMGHFKMGSTVIMLFPEQCCQWSAELSADSVVRMGEFFGETLLS